MATRLLEPEVWKEYFDRVTKTLVHEKQPIYTEVRIMNPVVGSQVETAWTPLIGLTYDPRGGSLEIATDPVDHLINAPTAVYVLEPSEGLPTVIEVVTADSRQVIELRY